MFTLQFLNFLACASVVVGAPKSIESRASQFKYLITFGDSYSQTGFSITGTKPSVSNPIGNPTFPGWTTSGGNNWIGNLLHPSSSTTLLNYNFASGGATTDANLVTPYASTVLSLVDQVSLFTKNLSPLPSPLSSSNTLFAIWIGVNDVGNAWYASNWSSLSQTIINRYIQEAATLYAGGARNFLFLTVPPIQRTPSVLQQSTSVQQQEGAAVQRYNQLLGQAVTAFKGNYTGVQTWVYDTTGPFNTALNNPTAYGAKDATCYNSDGVSCLWWNDYHPGLAIHKLVAQGVAALVGL
ncbi:carbohydrate esterase family 16 protein [Rutstroemia sp. NJR-2017a BBW]|nr:carbohydrate esterase family 16 protein [Rutstroemia sp. NJR-2017a BBW]